MSQHKLSGDCFLAYYVPHEAWYASVVQGEKPNIMVCAASADGGVAWEFKVTEHDLGGTTAQVNMFADAFDALEQIPAFFTALVEQQPTRLTEVRSLLDSLGAKDTTDREAPSMTGREILLRQAVESAALDAYSVVFEPSRKQVRDHQKATKAAVAAALLRLADEHQLLTDGERCCGRDPESQCARCGRGDETADWLRQQALRLDPEANARAER